MCWKFCKCQTPAIEVLRHVCETHRPCVGCIVLFICLFSLFIHHYVVLNLTALWSGIMAVT